MIVGVHSMNMFTFEFIVANVGHCLCCRLKCYSVAGDAQCMNVLAAEVFVADVEHCLCCRLVSMA